MELSPAEAATVARKHGLTLQDALGLLGLADTPEEADRIAARFAEPAASAAGRLLVRDLFGSAGTDPTGEGDPEPSARPSEDLELRRFASEVFDRSDP